MRNSKTIVLISCLFGISIQASFAQDKTQSKTEPQSVYEASTTAPEMVQIKSLNSQQFSKHAIDLCEKFGLDGPKEISKQEDRDLLLKKLSELRKEKFKELCDPIIRENEVEKTRVQNEMKMLTEIVNKFPELNDAAKTIIKLTPAETKLSSPQHYNLVAPGDCIEHVREEIEKEHGPMYTK